MPSSNYAPERPFKQHETPFSTTVNHSKPDLLTDYSPRDKPWDTHRSQADTVQYVYAGTEYDALAGRINDCSGFLGFGWVDDRGTGESRLKLREARFCRVRHCPVCQWRRSLMWQARFYDSLPAILESSPSARWVFLTLTVRNVPISDLRESITGMNKAWQRLIKRSEFAGNVLGWIRTTEVTRGKDDSAHPHFHCLMMVRPSYFNGKNYITQARWTELWQETARLNYVPVVDVRAVKPKGKNRLATLQGAVSETLKYAVKPSDMADEWLLELTRQVHKLRFIASGGALKNALREGDETNDDLLLKDSPELPEDDKPSLYFDWDSQHYRKRGTP